MSRLIFQRQRLSDLNANLIAAWLKITRNNDGFSSPFFSPYFALAVAQAVPEKCFVTIAFRDGQACGFFPFQYANPFFGRAERIGLYLSDYNGYIAEQPLEAGQLTTLLTASGIHQYAFDHLHEHQKRLGIDAEFIREGTATQLLDGFEQYWKGREMAVGRFTKDTVRSINKISTAVGPLRFQFHSADSDDLQNLIDCKRRQYQQTGVNDVMSSAWTQRCLGNLHAIQNRHFRGVLSSLYAGDTLISAHFGIAANSVLHYWFPAYNPEYSAYSPGRLLFYFMAKHAREHGITTIDNGMGAQKHKSDFANHTYQLGVGALRRKTLRCLLLRAQDYLNYRLF